MVLNNVERETQIVCSYMPILNNVLDIEEF